MKILLTTQLLASYQTEKVKEELCDTNPETIGLLYETRKSSPGTGIFRLRYKQDNSTKYIRLGRFPSEVSLDEVRARTKELKAQIQLGHVQVTTETIQPKANMTLQQAFDDIYVPLKQAQGKRSLDDDLAVFRLRIQSTPLASKKACDITKPEVSALHQQIRQNLAASTANHPVRLLKIIYNVLIDQDIGITLNPAKGIRLFDEPKVEHYLDDKQLKTLISTLEASPANSRFVFLFLLYTGSRLSEALKAEWQHVDIENRIWRIPAANSKSKRVRAVPLNDRAIEVLRASGTQDEYPYLFINPKTKKPYKQIHGPWKTIREAAGLPHLRIHDLRHELASLLVNSGRTLFEVQSILGHSDPRVTMRYASLSTRTMQEASNAAAVQIDKAVNTK